jgi:DNA primase
VAKAGGTGSTAGGDAWITSVHDSAVDDRVRALVTELVVEPVLAANEPNERYASAQLAQLRVRALDRQIADVKSRLQRINPVEQTTAYNRLFGDLIALEKSRRDDLEGTLGDS